MLAVPGDNHDLRGRPNRSSRGEGDRASCEARARRCQSIRTGSRPETPPAQSCNAAGVGHHLRRADERTAATRDLKGHSNVGNGISKSLSATNTAGGITTVVPATAVCLSPADPPIPVWRSTDSDGGAFVLRRQLVRNVGIPKGIKKRFDGN